MGNAPLGASRQPRAQEVQLAQEEREVDAAHLHAKISRLQALHSAALAAGSREGRQLLYSESLKSPAILRRSTLSWRGEDWQHASPTS